MTNEEINVAIAKECGWTVMQFGERNLYRPPEWDGGMAWERSKCPDYCNDLNAMHEAEKYLDDEQWLEHMLNLQDVLCRNPDRSKWTVCRENMSSTAHQRAEAFLKTLNLWKE